GGHRAPAHHGEQYVVLGLGELGTVEVRGHLAEEFMLRAEQSLPSLQGELAVGHAHSVLACADIRGERSKGRSERLPTGPCPLHQECPAITCGVCHSKHSPCDECITAR